MIARHSLILALLWGASALAPRSVQGQITSLADDIILITKGVENERQMQVDSRLGGDIGGTASKLGYSPGSGTGRPQVRYVGPASGSSFRTAGRDIIQSAEGEAQRQPSDSLRDRPPERLPPPTRPFLGALEIPEQEDEGPPDGLTLDAAMGLLTRQNFELRTKWYEIPQARADVLTANLRSNPLVFGTAANVPYGSYSPQRPGEISYGATVIYPLDVSHKRLARTEVACQARAVIEAQYQDAVRIELDRLNLAFVDVVAARDTLRYARASRDGLVQIARAAQRQLDSQQIARPDFDRIAIQLDSAEIGVEQATVALRESKHVLGLLLAIKIEAAEQIQIHGSMRDSAPEPPADDELLAIARGVRPDLVAYRLGVRRAEADVQLAVAEKTADVFLLYTPWQLQNNTPIGGQNATSWSLAAFGSVPLFNRNQGNIRRAELNVSQTRTELAGLEQQVAEEVHSAYVEYMASRDVVKRLENSVLPRSRRIRAASARLLAEGQTSTVEFLTAQREHNDVVRQYRDALIRHRRSMLRLNTAVGQRILP